VFDRAGGVRFSTYVLDEDGDPAVDEEGELIVYGETIVMGQEEGEEAGTEIEIPYNTMSSCLDLASSDFSNINLPSGGYSQTAYFMNWTIHAPTMDWGWCPQNGTAIQYAQNNETKLHTFIDNIRLHDGTGTQYGMKYGIALLNPTSNATFQALNAEGLVPDEFTNRPAAFDDDETRKIIVLMTDGQITDQYRPKDALHPENGEVALLDRGNNKADRYSYAKQSNNVSNFNSVCEKAKDQGVTIYTIAFEAPNSARNQMRDCATSSAYFYKVEGVEISTVFKSIARQINDLRLVN
jgi:hypothetical protein